MTGANVARAMQLSAPTVHEMIGRLERDGYVTRGADKALAFTDSGLEHAEGIVRRHRLIERFLTDVLGIPWDEVHEEAERLEHAMSPVLEQRMLAAIGDAKTCPHGHPIHVGDADRRGAAGRRRGRRQGAHPALRERGRGPAALPQGRRASSRALEGELTESDEDARHRRRSAGGRCEVSRSVAETVLGRRRPVAAAAHGAARAARALQGPLRPLGDPARRRRVDRPRARRASTRSRRRVERVRRRRRGGCRAARRRAARCPGRGSRAPRRRARSARG